MRQNDAPGIAGRGRAPPDSTCAQYRLAARLRSCASPMQYVKRVRVARRSETVRQIDAAGPSARPASIDRIDSTAQMPEDSDKGRRDTVTSDWESATEAHRWESKTTRCRPIRGGVRPVVSIEDETGRPYPDIVEDYRRALSAYRAHILAALAALSSMAPSNTGVATQ